MILIQQTMYDCCNIREKKTILLDCTVILAGLMKLGDNMLGLEVFARFHLSLA